MGSEGNSGGLEIAVFARAPVLGAVKKRLAAEIGEGVALAVYERLLSRAISAAVEACSRRPDLRPVLWHLGEWPASFPLPPEIAANMRRQPSDDMLDNLRAALRVEGAESRRGAIAIGADHPALSAAHILELAALLGTHDVAVGPAEDGGFWAVGATVEIGDALGAIPLGTGGALGALVGAVRSAGYSCASGPVLYDVDTAADLTRWRSGMHRQ